MRRTHLECVSMDKGDVMARSTTILWRFELLESRSPMTAGIGLGLTIDTPPAEKFETRGHYGLGQSAKNFS